MNIEKILKGAEIVARRRRKKISYDGATTFR
jgi:hypothetical protein